MMRTPYVYPFTLETVRKIVIAGNWKMHKTQAETLDFFEAVFGASE